MGFNKVTIMEEYKEKISKMTEYGGIDEKFEWLVEQNQPEVFFAFFHKDTRMDAVIFEIGWICGRFGTKKINTKLKFLFESGYDFQKQQITAYIDALFSKIPRKEFDESKNYSKSSELIRTFLVSN